MDIVIAATFTAEPLRDSLNFWIKTLNLSCQCFFTPPTPIITQLLDKNQPFHLKNGIKVLLVRLDDCLADGKWNMDIVTGFATEFCDAIEEALNYRSQQIIVAFCPCDNTALTKLTQDCINKLNALKQVITIAPNDFSTYYPANQQNNPSIRELTSIPYTPLQYCAIGSCLIRKVVSTIIQPFKVIIVDCDNTLWDGICGEIGPRAVKINSGHLWLQQFLIDQINLGMLVCICSKNNKADVEAVFKQHPKMLLKKTHVTLWKVNWHSKTDNLVKLAATLNLNLDSFILIDDDESVCARVRSQLPMVLTLQLPQRHEKFQQFIQHVWAFDHRQQTLEDSKRTQFYQQNIERLRLKKHSKSVEDYLAQLEIKINIKPARPAHLERITQLTQRTNQFNFSPKHFTFNEIHANYHDESKNIWIVDVRDHYGDYGIVGTIFFEINHKALNVTTLLLSCRALGRKVEHAIFAKLARLAHKHQCGQITFQFTRTDKNQPAQLFLQSLAQKAALPTSKFAFDPQWLLDHINEIPIQPEGKSSADNKALVSSKLLLAPEILYQIALSYQTASQIFQAIQQAKHRPRPQLSSPYQAAKNQLEMMLTEIWSQSLTTDPIGVNDNFFELGGTSIIAAEIIARINNDLNLKLRIIDLLNHPTIAQLTVLVSNYTTSPNFKPINKNSIQATKIPASQVQQRLWFMQKIAKNPEAYNQSLSLALTGKINLKVLKESLQQVLTRHTIFQTGFTLTAGELLQKIEPISKHPIETIDYSDYKEAEKLARAKSHATKFLKQPFKLNEAPLWRIKLIRLNKTHYWLVIIMHHILIDGWSTGKLYQEIANTYNARLNAKQKTITPAEIQYSDFSIWEQENIQDSDDIHYWKTYLAKSPSVSTFPLDKARPRQPCGDGEQLKFEIAEEFSNQLKIFCHAEQATVFMTLLASINALLFRWTHQTDNIIATPTINRDHPQLSQCIGMFANTLPIRTKLKPEMTFRELIQEIKANTLDCLSHQKLSLQHIIKAAGTSHNLNCQPLFQILFVLQSDPLDGVTFSGLKQEIISLDNGCSLFDITFSVTATPNGFSGSIEYATALYHRQTIERIQKCWLVLLSSALSDPTQTLSTLQLTSEQVYQDSIKQHNNTIAPLYCVPSILSLWQQQVQRLPNHIAVIDHHNMSYATIDKKADQLASHLFKLNTANKQAVVAVCLDRSADLIISMVAIIKLGAVYVPLNPSLPTSRLNFIIKDAEVTHIIGSNQTLSRLNCKLASININNLDDNINTPSLFVETDPKACAYIIYTSGSTGKPKGITMPYQALNNLIFWQIKASQLKQNQKSLQFNAISFDVSIQEIWSTLCCGATLVITPENVRNDVIALHSLIVAHELHRVFFPVIVLHKFCDYAMSINHFPHSLIEIICSGDQLKITNNCRTLLQNSLCKLINQYGPSETHVVSCYQVTVKDLKHKIYLPPIGKAITNMEMYNLDHQLRPLPPGIIGELFIGGVGLATGYQHLHELTQEKFIQHPFSKNPDDKLYRTGDLVRCHPDGTFEFITRVDHQIKLNGFRIEPAEIEISLNNHPSIIDSVVITRDYPSSGKILVAYYVAKGKKDLQPSELNSFLRESLPTYMIPQFYVPLASFPLTQHNKVDREALPDVDLSRPNIEYANISAEQNKLLLILKKILKNPLINIYDNLFTVGMHSLLLTRLSHEIHNHFGITIPLCELYHCATVFELSKCLAGHTPKVGKQRVLKHHELGTHQTEKIS